MLWLIPLLLLAAAAGITVYAYRFTFYSSPKRKDNPYLTPSGEQYQPSRQRMHDLIREMEAIPFESVTVTSFDGTALFARYYHVRDGAPLQIQCHGYRGTALRDFCGGNKLARESGQNTLVIDQRAHGKSEGKIISFGVRERYDCLRWIEYACERFGKDTPIFLSGVSMGAATVLMTADLELPENVVGIIADCPYSSPAAIIRKVCGDMKMAPAVTMPFVRLAARLGGFDLGASAAVESVKKARIPILLIHGDDDRFVPCDMSREIAAACASPITFAVFPGAGHGLCYMEDTERYNQLAEDFTKTCLAAKGY